MKIKPAEHVPPPGIPRQIFARIKNGGNIRETPAMAEQAARCQIISGYCHGVGRARGRRFVRKHCDNFYTVAGLIEDKVTK